MAKRNKLQQYWLKLSPTVRSEVVSVLQTFLAVFAATVAFSFESTGSVALSADALIAVFIAAARSGVKAAWMLAVKHVAAFSTPKE